MTLSCREDSGEFIFEMPFQNLEFELPAGLSTFNAYVQEFELDSNIDFFLASNSTDTTSIKAFNPAFARIQALDNGVDFEYIREISIRICPIGDDPCTLVDEVFYSRWLLHQALPYVSLLVLLVFFIYAVVGMQVWHI